ncbi:MAG: RNA polymerase sigma factor [Pseudomonadota bacterium]
MTLHSEDRAMARRLIRGDRRAFDRFFRDNFPRLFRFAIARLHGDEQATAEVVLKSLNKAISKLDQYRGEAAMFTWLCAICRNDIVDHLRAIGRYREHIVLVEDSPEVQAVVDSLAAGVSMSPEANQNRRDALRLIQVALDQLPPSYGDALEWKYIEGFSVAEIAERLCVGREAAQSLLARAKRAFRETYSALTAQGAETLP